MDENFKLFGWSAMGVVGACHSLQKMKRATLCVRTYLILIPLLLKYHVLVSDKHRRRRRAAQFCLQHQYH